MVRSYNGNQEREREAILGTLKYVYDEVYRDVNYGPILTAHGLLAALSISQRIPPDGKVLCVGAGNAYEAVHFKMRGFDVRTFDYHVPKIDYLESRQVVGDCNAIAFKDNYFDLVQCCEMLEHVKPESADACLSELFRVGRHIFRFTIADKEDPYGDLHLCVKPVEWWREKMEKIGYFIYHIEIKPRFTVFMLVEGSGLGIKEWLYPSGYLIEARKLPKEDSQDIPEQVGK